MFDQPTADEAKAVVESLRRQHGIEVDSRKTHVRVGVGYNHNPEDIDRLLRALALDHGSKENGHKTP